MGGLDTEALLQVGLAILLGGAIGFERELRGRAAGLRTMILVCLGSTLVMLISTRLTVAHGGGASSSVVRVDPSRIAAGIVTGVGFLGAGVIVKLGDLIRGVTTAATIWFVAAIGIAIGDGRYGIAIAATFIAIGVLVLLQFPERMLRSHIYRVVRITAELPQADAVLTDAKAILLEPGVRILDLRVDQDIDQSATLLTLHLRTTQSLQGYDIVRRLGVVAGVRRVSWD